MIAILESYRAGLLERAYWGRNLIAGVIVGVVDTTGLSALDEIVADFQRAGTRVVLCEVRPNVIEKLERAQILARVGARGVYETLSDFLTSGSR